MPQHFKYSRATFTGKNNLTKSWVFVTLLDHRDHGDNSGLDAYRLALLTECPESSIKCRARFWVKWGYITRRVGTNRYGRPVFVYKLAKRGEEFINIRMPSSLRECIECELAAHKKALYNPAIKHVELAGDVIVVSQQPGGQWVRDAAGHMAFISKTGGMSIE
jgi:hypothetical protein